MESDPDISPDVPVIVTGNLPTLTHVCHKNSVRYGNIPGDGGQNCRKIPGRKTCRKNRDNVL